MKKYRIKCEEQIFELACDRVTINEEGNIDIITDGAVVGCFSEWVYFYQIVTPKEDVEAIKKYYQGFSYKPPKFRNIEAIEKIVDALNELREHVDVD